MKIKVLGSAGSEVPGHNCPAFLIDGKILLDGVVVGLVTGLVGAGGNDSGGCRVKRNIHAASACRYGVTIRCLSCVAYQYGVLCRLSDRYGLSGRHSQSRAVLWRYALEESHETRALEFISETGPRVSFGEDGVRVVRMHAHDAEEHACEQYIEISCLRHWFLDICVWAVNRQQSWFHSISMGWHHMSV